MVDGWNLDLDSFDSVAAHESLTVTLLALLLELQSKQPLNRLLGRGMGVRLDLGDHKRSEGEAREVASRVDSLDLLEGGVVPGGFLLQRSVVAWSHGGVGVVAWIC